MTDRRTFLTLALVTLAAPVAAQGPERVVKIGFLVPGLGRQVLVEAFRQGLRDLGYVEGKNLIMELRVAREPREQPALITELVNLNVDVLATWTTPAAIATARATSTIPIVVMTGDPTRTGLVGSLARPGGNVTGIAILVDELEAKKLQLLKEAVPAVSRVAVMWNPDNPVWVHVVERLREVAPRLGVNLQDLPVTDANHFEGALRSVTTTGVGALLVVEESLFMLNRKHLTALVANNRLPAIYPQPDFIDLGGLMSYSVSLPDMLRRLPKHVDKILRGARPADLPVEQPTKFELVINLKTAKALGLTIPPSLLLRADQVIE